MDRNFLVQLTIDLYRLTLLFPKKEPLRYKMRELGDDILADLIKILLPNPSKLAGGDPLLNLEILDSFFEVARAQNWVNSEEISKLQKDYSKIKEELKTEVYLEKTQILPFQTELPPVKTKINTLAKYLNERQEKILAILREKGRAQVWEVKEILPQVSKRTLRRDFRNLLKQGLIERRGERNETFYQLKLT